MKAERRNITQPGDWWDAFETQANIMEMSLSEWIGYSCFVRLPKRLCEELSARLPAHRPPAAHGRPASTTAMITTPADDSINVRYHQPPV